VIRLLVSAAVGAVAARLVWLVVRPVFADPSLMRTNWRGRALPTAAGAVLPVVLLLVEAGRSLGAAAGGDLPGGTVARFLVVTATVGFALLGAIDDLLGSGEVRGFRGHVGALVSGRVTTGVVKLVGGAALALVVVAPLSRSVGRLVLDAAVVALAANLGNLLDRAPGRVIKASVAAFVAVAVAARARASLEGVAVVVGAAIGLAVDDLRERLMLGDTGANVLGAVLGLAIVLGTGPGARTVALLAVATLNVAGELVSFSRLIDAVPPLRALDRAGRLP